MRRDLHCIVGYTVNSPRGPVRVDRVCHTGRIECTMRDGAPCTLDPDSVFTTPLGYRVMAGLEDGKLLDHIDALEAHARLGLSAGEQITLNNCYVRLDMLTR